MTIQMVPNSKHWKISLIYSSYSYLSLSEANMSNHFFLFVFMLACVTAATVVVSFFSATIADAFDCDEERGVDLAYDDTRPALDDEELNKDLFKKYCCFERTALRLNLPMSGVSSCRLKGADADIDVDLNDDEVE